MDNIIVEDRKLPFQDPSSLRWSALLGVCFAIVLGTRAEADPRAVVELFTSQGCSSCPAADKVLGELSRDPSIIAMSMPIDYWDYLGWKDTLANSRFSAKQKAYSHMRGDREVYTPQVVVNGAVHVLGSDRASIQDAATRTRAEGGVMSVPVSIKQADKQLNVTVSAGNGAAEHGEVWVCAISREVPIRIGRGENRGREVTYYNVVRNWLKVGDWTGKPGTWTVPLENIKSEGVDAAVVYVQDGNREKPGLMLGAAYTALH
ncbi:DUF1223 domain-containing protein [Bradyrhizobium sp. U87765 SZCCT0131]|uniref:DUF1223 domain-containing protein n=1 Tax=unclassified Bradyrhizobium TaxID=2631580 RepID=UPI001BAD668E|nr:MULTISPECIES: DUF1223 domain-containing protein [unclassified Bradyrhizobium]MBR1217007.1 DUF1223 domain-containing protein [Bradyrhizobium sp. U87765 SZCCT0131]MBR1259237.1 DUF1223 domain-containing protein [Bradyrhizobium sp. U87765 SZCCT0134]MBR1305378.1 DUF1223 domain-containing protein [Bradyrhizobium sp. U87765 SZCCT0110]MBR1321164.1 DUF1223 domain-containing protein [Bradyrhizobium sp. U87765 SZCCT0109]MBR1350182.1 DUF1223 domain-containing protein [Bradyrhizobium sp. U87765 SZCCT004